MSGEPASAERADPPRAPTATLGVACGLALAILVACTAPAKYTLAPGHEGAPGVRRVLLCPMNVALALPSEVSVGAGPVYEQIEAYLGAHALQIRTLGLTEARGLWRKAAIEARQSGSQDAAGIFAKKVGGSIEIDAVVMPSLILRTVQVSDNSGTWDGVRRSISMVNLPHRGHGVEADTFSKGVALGGMSGPVMAASLHVMAYLPDGRRVFEGIGGFDFVQEADLGSASQYHWELRPNPGRMLRREVLSEGVQIAFGPYLPPRSDR